MNKRPRSITIISWIFIVMGAGASLTRLLPPVDPTAAQHIAGFKAQHPVQYYFLFAGPILALVCGVFLLRGCNWARWLLTVWLGSHVVIHFLHSPVKALVPAVASSVLIYFLFRPPAKEFFRGVEPGAQGAGTATN
ncbi:MAG: hypothetical protein AB1705_05100 [Verrucomicrobiota bacterium]